MSIQITPENIAQNQKSANELLKLTKAYNNHVSNLAHAAEDIGKAILTLSTAKGAETSGDGLKIIAAYYEQIGQNMNTMNALITRDFETPLSRNITLHTNNVTTNEKKFDKDRKKMEDGIKSTEGKMGKMSKKKGSDLQAFQATISDLQSQASRLEESRAQHSKVTNEAESKNFSFILQKAAVLIKAEADIYDRNTKACKDRMEKVLSIAYAPSKGEVPKGALDAFVAQQQRNSFSSFSGSDTAPVSKSSAATGQDSAITRKDSTGSGGVLTPPFSNQTSPTEELDNMISSMSVKPKTSSMSIFRSRSTAKATSPIGTTSATRIESAVPQDITETNNACQSSIESETMFADASASTSTSPAPRPVSEEPSSGSGVSSPLRRDTLRSRSCLYAITQHSFTARDDRELSVEAKDALIVRDRQEQWMFVEIHKPTRPLTKKTGWIPTAYAKLVTEDQVLC